MRELGCAWKMFRGKWRKAGGPGSATEKEKGPECAVD
jgi:hypothetical protein